MKMVRKPGFRTLKIPSKQESVHILPYISSVPSPRLTAKAHLKNDAWKTTFFCWDGLVSGANRWFQEYPLHPTTPNSFCSLNLLLSKTPPKKETWTTKAKSCWLIFCWLGILLDLSFPASHLSPNSFFFLWVVWFMDPMVYGILGL